MTNSDDVKEFTATIKTDKNTTKVNDKNKAKAETPLIRYFDLADDSSDCYVLGYN